MRNYRELYALAAKHPDYRAARQNEFVAALVHSHTDGRTCSKREMTDKELRGLCAWLRTNWGDRKSADERRREVEMWRRRAMAAVGEYCRRQGYPQTQEYIIGVILAACEATDFNRIGVSKLRGLYSEFCRRNRVGEKVGAMERRERAVVQVSGLSVSGLKS